MLVQKTTSKCEITEVEQSIPSCGEDDVLVKIIRVGICGSDMQIYHGLHPTAKFPLVQGHEGCGIVQRTGSNVEGFKAGDRVVIFPLNYCGRCYACRSGKHNLCINLSFVGVGQDGLFSEYVILSPHNLYKIPEDMDIDAAALVEPTAVGVAAAKRVHAGAGKNIIVLGAGPIGNLTAQVCHAFGANVLATDHSDEKLSLLSKSGIHTINTAFFSLDEKIESCFESGIADIIIDCVGTSSTLEQAINTSSNGSTILVVGNLKQPIMLQLPVLQRREVDLLGTFLYDEMAFDQSLKLLYNKSINIGGFITAHFSLSQLPAALSYIENNPANTIKVLIDF